jgi:hypothetical protein
MESDSELTVGLHSDLSVTGILVKIWFLKSWKSYLKVANSVLSLGWKDHLTFRIDNFYVEKFHWKFPSVLKLKTIIFTDYETNI